MAEQHPRAFAVAQTVTPKPFDWIKDKHKLIAIVDALTDDIVGDQIEALKSDPFLLEVAQGYCATVLLDYERRLGWDHPNQSDQGERALLAFLARGWVFKRVTGRLR